MPLVFDFEQYFMTFGKKFPIMTLMPSSHCLYNSLLWHNTRRQKDIIRRWARPSLVLWSVQFSDKTCRSPPSTPSAQQTRPKWRTGL